MRMSDLLSGTKLRMTTLNKPLMPTEKDVLMARESQRQIGCMKFGRKESIGMQIEGKLISVPVSVARLLIQALSRMAEGKALAMIPLDEEVSPQDAAELLSASRPFAAKFLMKARSPASR